MPTGYTAFIEDGDITTGKEFLLLCLRNFGIAIDVRDEPLTVPAPTHFKPCVYTQNRYIAAIEHLKEVKNISFDVAKQQMTKEHRDRVDFAKQALAKMTKINERYKKVRDQVLAWVPPTPEHMGIREFALEQIDMCINTDSAFDYYQKIIETPFDDSDQAVQQYIQKQIEFCEDDVSRAQEAWDEEIKRTNQKNEFMQLFLESLKNLPGEAGHEVH